MHRVGQLGRYARLHEQSDGKLLRRHVQFFHLSGQASIKGLDLFVGRACGQDTGLLQLGRRKQQRQILEIIADRETDAGDHRSVERILLSRKLIVLVVIGISAFDRRQHALFEVAVIGGFHVSDRRTIAVIAEGFAYFFAFLVGPLAGLRTGHDECDNCQKSDNFFHRFLN